MQNVFCYGLSIILLTFVIVAEPRRCSISTSGNLHVASKSHGASVNVFIPVAWPV